MSEQPAAARTDITTLREFRTSAMGAGARANATVPSTDGHTTQRRGPVPKQRQEQS